jgi:hypothetical protein
MIAPFPSLANGLLYLWLALSGPETLSSLVLEVACFGCTLLCLTSPIVSFVSFVSLFHCYHVRFFPLFLRRYFLYLSCC